MYRLTLSVGASQPPLKHTKTMTSSAPSPTSYVLQCLSSILSGILSKKFRCVSQNFYRLQSSGYLIFNLQSLLIIVWALRLGIYLFSRALKRGDARMKKYDDQPLRFLIPFFLQTLWVFIMSSPTYLLNKTSSPELTFSVYFGWTFWGIGFIIEALADYQKSVFLDDEANDGKFIKTGLWSISRHPNYFGEIMLWSGLFISAAGSFTSSIEYLSIFSIAFIYLLLRFVSGISLLEKNGEKRWGHQELLYLVKT